MYETFLEVLRESERGRALLLPMTFCDENVKWDDGNQQNCVSHHTKWKFTLILFSEHGKTIEYVQKECRLTNIRFFPTLEVNSHALK